MSLTKQVQALMGRKVVITHTVEMVCQGETLKREEITQLPEPVEGWVMGLRWRQAGKYHYVMGRYPYPNIHYTVPVPVILRSRSRSQPARGSH